MISPQTPSEPLRILMSACVPRRREGGVATMIFHLGEELEKRGHFLTYVFQEDLFGQDRISPRFADLIFSRRLNRYIAENRANFSIVNLHAPAGVCYGMHRRWLGSPNDPPYVMTLHGLEERRIYAQTREAKKGRAWNFALHNRLWHRFFRMPLFRWSIRTADGAHTISRDAWNFLLLRYNLDFERTACIHNGVEERFFLPRRYDSPGPLKLLYAGTWLDQRGIFYIRDALLRLASRLPGLTMTFAGCGAPPEVIRDFFGPQLTDTLVVAPTLPSENMHQLYASHDVFLFPSLVEGLPVVLLEAMASGMPVITTETCGMQDIVENEYNGILIPPADDAAIETAVVRLAQSAPLRMQLGQLAQETLRRYTWERSAIQLEELFRRVLLLKGRTSR